MPRLPPCRGGGGPIFAATLRSGGPCAACADFILFIAWGPKFMGIGCGRGSGALVGLSGAACSWPCCVRSNGCGWLVGALTIPLLPFTLATVDEPPIDDALRVLAGLPPASAVPGRDDSPSPDDVGPLAPDMDPTGLRLIERAA
jgi:hypothetical protein